MIVLSITGCGVNGAVVQEKTNEIKVGFVGPLTGEAASWGQNAMAGISLAVKEINDAGGIHGKKIKLISEDGKCGGESVTAVRKLIDIDKVQVMLGPICSPEAEPVVPILQEYNMPTVMPTPSAPGLTAGRDAVFRVYPSDSLQGAYAADFIYNDLGKRKVALIYVENTWGAGLNKVFTQRFKELGGKIVYNDNVMQEEEDFRTIITKIKKTDAEAIYAPIYANNAIAAFKQMQELGLDLPVVGGDVLNAEEVVKSGTADGVWYIVPLIDVPENFKAKILSVSGYSNLDVNLAASTGYDAANVMFEAIKKVGTNKNQLKQAIAATSMKGISNPVISFDREGDLKNAAMEVRVIKGKESVAYT